MVNTRELFNGECPRYSVTLNNLRKNINKNAQRHRHRSFLKNAKALVIEVTSETCGEWPTYL